MFGKNGLQTEKRSSNLSTQELWKGYGYGSCGFERVWRRAELTLAPEKASPPASASANRFGTAFAAPDNATAAHRYHTNPAI
ncbi:unnamed protein product [Heligmosomoides polygyrus]|uniref:Uncharacterized protein n=1 Tax=Heligmosomoides polygyrus TaxID=6339 RepID=A0A183FB95_HELPZ|nr:unnamed protein product [Heligmosomoides polygyrus]